MRPIYIIGHKNPDTDSIVSSIAYAEYKKAKGIEAIASRIGPVSSDTEYLLNRFGFEDPLHIYTAKSTIREIDYDKAVLIDKDITIKEANDKIQKTKTHTIYVTDKERKLLGVVTLDSISKVWFADEKKASKIVKQAKLKDIAKTLKGKILVEPSNYKINGLIDLSPVKNADLVKGTIAITSNIEKIKNAIKEEAGLIIVLDEIKINKEIIKDAFENNVAIISSPLSAINVAKLIYVSSPIETVMTKVDLVSIIKDTMTTDEATTIISKTRYRAYPIIDGHNMVIGSVSRYNLLNYEKKKFILVDHNEKKQSIDNIEFGEILEIVDHHRFGGFESTDPIEITSQIVGATTTIIASKFLDENMKISKNLAGLMLGGIVADTMNFKSPTTTKTDIEIAKKLEKISQVKASDIQEGLIKSSISITQKRAKNICYDDFKEYEISGLRIGLANAICSSYEDYMAIKSPVLDFIEEVCERADYDLFVVMLTDPNGSGSYLIYQGDRADLIKKTFPKITNNNFVTHLISRKKQLLPRLIETINS